MRGRFVDNWVMVLLFANMQSAYRVLQSPYYFGVSFIDTHPVVLGLVGVA